MTTILDKDCVNASEVIVEMYIKPRALTMFGHTEYYLDGPLSLIAALGLNEKSFNSYFGICIDVKHFSVGICRQIRMNKVCRYLGLHHNILEHMSILQHKIGMRRAIFVPGKHGMEDLLLVLNAAELNPEAIAPIRDLPCHDA